MGIFRSGILKLLQVQCVKPLKEGNFQCEEGQLYDVVMDMGDMMVIRNADGAEALVPKDAFEEPQQS